MIIDTDKMHKLDKILYEHLPSVMILSWVIIFFVGILVGATK